MRDIFGSAIARTEELQDMGFVLILLSSEPVQHDESLAYVITTSGTTGAPKVVRVPHSCILPNITDIM